MRLRIVDKPAFILAGLAVDTSQADQAADAGPLAARFFAPGFLEALRDRAHPAATVALHADWNPQDETYRLMFGCEVAGADQPHGRQLGRSTHQRAGQMYRRERNRDLNDGKPDEIGIKRCPLGPIDRFTQGITVDHTHHREQHHRGSHRHVPAKDYQQTKRKDRQCNENLCARHRRAMQVESNAARHRQHECNRQRRCRAMRGGEASDRNDRRQMVEADYGMAQSRQEALTEGRRHAAAHDVMRESRRRTGGRCDKGQPKTYQLPIHCFFSQRDHSPLRAA